MSVTAYISDKALMGLMLMAAMPVIYSAQAASLTTKTSEQSKQTEIKIDGVKAMVSATSELEPGKGRYSAANAFDGDVKTAWVEGAENSGDGSFLTVEFEEPTTIDGFVLRPGYVKNINAFTENAVPRKIELHVDGNLLGSYTVNYDLDFVYWGPDGPKIKGPQVEGCYHTGAKINVESPRAVIFSSPVEGRTFRLTVIESLVGTRYKDLAITDWKPLLTGSRDCQFNCEIAEILKSIRGNNSIVKYFNQKSYIEDLRTKYLHGNAYEPYVYSKAPLEYHSEEEFFRWPPREWKFPYFARIKREERSMGDTPDARFIRYTKDSLLDAVVLIETRSESYRIIGTQSFRYGDGEWLEFFPVIEIDNRFQITSISELAQLGGSPDCHDIIPREVSRNKNK